MRRVLALLWLSALAACRDAPGPLAPGDEAADASLLDQVSGSSPPTLDASAEGSLPGRWIVTLRPGVAAVAAGNSLGLRPDYVYTRALNGFAVRLSESAARALLRDGRILSIEPDGIVSATTTETNAPWGLDRIDQRKLPIDTRFHYTATGQGVTAYVIDTGIRFNHAEFSGRAVSLVDEIDGGAADDCFGHGTHVAGTLGGETYGVAKDVKLVAVRVLDCNGFGTWSQVIAGIDAVIADHQAGTPAVANLSLGGPKRASVNTAIKNLIADGVTTVVSAGNGNIFGVAQDACTVSPASVRAAITVGATDATDTKASWSNFGDCVDWFAPGVDIVSAWISGANATATLSGTSMSAPHTSGVAGLYLQGNPSASPAEVRSALFTKTTKGIVKAANTTTNHLLFTKY
jgi:subtilisin family serine protease